MDALPFSRLSNEQILALLREKPMIERVPGVTLVWVDDAGPDGSETTIAVYVDSRHRGSVCALPTVVAGVPVVARIEDRRSLRILETIDPRENGGLWCPPARVTR